MSLFGSWAPRRGANRGRLRAALIAAPLVVAAGLLASGSACTPGPYSCSSSAQCISSDGTQGVCTNASFCSYPDTACPTQQRYSASAGSGLANQCVGTGPASCVSQIAVGQDFACYVRSDGTVWCWGSNSNGQLGDGTTTDRSAPVQVKFANFPPAQGVTAIEVQVAEYHACALFSDGTLQCWGYNDQSNLGQCKPYNNGQGYVGSSTPVLMNYATFTPLSADGGTGQNGEPWTCDGGPLKVAIPTAANGLINTLSVGGEHTCVIDVNSHLLCWGENLTNPVGGQAGQDFNLYPTVDGPTIVTGSQSTALQTQMIADVECGDDYSCLLTGNGQAYCWGGNQDGELGSGNTMNPTWSATPLLIPLPTAATTISVDDETACALSQGTVNCWGNGSTGITAPGLNGQLQNAVATPVIVGQGSKVFGGPNSETICIESPSDTLQCWGSNSSGQAATGSLTPVNITTPTTSLLDSVTQLKLGADNGCALTAGGELLCFGDDSFGQLGNNTVSTTPSPTPVAVQVTCP